MGGEKLAFLDWLLGESYIGWLKTALLSLAFGLPIVMALYRPEDVSGGGARFVVIALGYPILALARHLYWDWRKKSIVQLLINGDPRAAAEIDAIAKWRPALHYQLRSLQELASKDSALAFLNSDKS
jgi:hypothetical protein